MSDDDDERVEEEEEKEEEEEAEEVDEEALAKAKAEKKAIKKAREAAKRAVKREQKEAEKAERYGLKPKKREDEEGNGGDEEEEESDEEEAPSKRALKRAKAAQKKGPPPADYVCAACKTAGHWVYDCPDKVRNLAKKKRRQEGGGDQEKKKPKAAVDNPKQREPTAEDIAKAQAAMPIIKPSQAPLCHCGKRAHARKNRDKNSPWFGLMVWWCAKDRKDESNCGYARRAHVMPD
jgi:hypothetical protein